MNDLTTDLVFTSAERAMRDPEFLSGDLWLRTSVRQRLRREVSALKDPIPWRRDNSKNKKTELATVVDDYRDIESYEKAVKRSQEYEHKKLKSYKIDLIDNTNTYIDISSTVSNIRIFYENNIRSDYTYTTYTPDTTYTSNLLTTSWYDTGTSSNSYYYRHYLSDDKSPPPDPPKLLPIGTAEDIRILKREHDEMIGSVCMSCGKKLTLLPKSFSKYSNLGYCMSCALRKEKSYRTNKEDREDSVLYSTDRYPSGWNPRRNRFSSDAEFPWWLDL